MPTLMPASPTSRYAVALGLFAGALAFRLVFVPPDGGLVFSTFYVATVLALYFCGPGPSALVIALSVGVGVYFFASPHGSWALGPTGAVAPMAYLATSAVAAWVGCGNCARPTGGCSAANRNCVPSSMTRRRCCSASAPGVGSCS